MTIVSEFEGIEICFYHDDHLPPHFIQNIAIKKN